MLKYLCKNDSKSKKKSRFVQCMARVFKKTAHNSSEVTPSTTYFLTEAPKSPIKSLNTPILSTWPGEKLKTTVGMLLNQESVSSSNDINDIECEIEKVVNETCPFQIQDQYDFCILCAQNDINDATSLKEELNSTFNLAGYTVWDYGSLGSDRFFALEDLLLTSTVILLYISNNFVKDEFCCHVARNVLITPITERARLRVIPLLKDLDTPIPETLQLVDKLVLQNKLRFNFRFSTIFSDSVRLEKLGRRYKAEEDIDLRRMHIILELVKNKVVK